MAGYGLADVKAGLPITADSFFDLASVSKHMTGVAILTLVEKGKLTVERPVADYLKGLPRADNHGGQRLRD